MDFKVTLTANARELANALIVLDRHVNQIKTDIPVLDQLNKPDPVAREQPVKKTKKEPVAAPTPEEQEEDGTTGTVDMEALRDLVMARSKAGHKSAIVALLKKYKAKTVPEIEPSLLGSFYQEISAL